VAHVAEDWIVDEHGNFLKTDVCGPSETVHGPDPYNTWTCEICGAVAEVVDE